MQSNMNYRQYEKEIKFALIIQFMKGSKNCIVGKEFISLKTVLKVQPQHYLTYVLCLKRTSLALFSSG